MLKFIFGKNPELSWYEMSNLLDNHIRSKAISSEKRNLTNYNWLHNKYLSELDESLPVATADLMPLNAELTSNQQDILSRSVVSGIVTGSAGTVRLVEEIEDDFELAKFNEFSFLKWIDGLPDKFELNINTFQLTTDQVELLKKQLKRFTRTYKLKVRFSYNHDQLASPKLTDLELSFVSSEANSTRLRIWKTLATNTGELDIWLDKHRPQTKLSHASSFRLARFLVNLLPDPLLESKLDQQGDVRRVMVFDPFMGTATQLMQCMLSGYDVFGVDIDAELVGIAKKNLNWLVNQDKLEITNMFEIQQGSCLQIPLPNFDYVVFEPYMGPFLSEIPEVNHAKKIYADLIKLYSKLFKKLSSAYIQNIKKSPHTQNYSAKVVCVLPSIPAKNDDYLDMPSSVYTGGNWQLMTVDPIPYTTSSGSRLRRYVYCLSLQYN